MRDRRPRGGVRLGGADVHAAVHLARVGDQDLDREPRGQRQRQLGLARGGRPDDADERRMEPARSAGLVNVAPAASDLDQALHLLDGARPAGRRDRR